MAARFVEKTDVPVFYLPSSKVDFYERWCNDALHGTHRESDWECLLQALHCTQHIHDVLLSDVLHGMLMNKKVPVLLGSQSGRL